MSEDKLPIDKPQNSLYNKLVYKRTVTYNVFAGRFVPAFGDAWWRGTKTILLLEESEAHEIKRGVLDGTDEQKHKTFIFSSSKLS